MSKVIGEVSWKQKVFFKELDTEDLHEVVTKMHQGIKHNQRFIITTNYTTLVAIDTKTEEKLHIEIIELPKHFDFFLPWAGMEKTQHQDENPADVKAAEKMAKLFDSIKKDNHDDSPQFVHGLNVFLSRLLFCFFAEDTGIFTDNQVTNAIDSHTQKDGSDLDIYLTQLFEVLDTPEEARGELPENLSSFPYVNGALFRERFIIPKFSRRSRQTIIDSGEMDWSDINPDIFGSMFQAVIAIDQRSSLGQHYTSVPNIMKVIEPLFLNELYDEFEKAKGNKTKLGKLLQRFHKIKIFDPACGSGNFLIIAYKELRRLEMKIFKESEVMPLSGIHLSQFYGIELDDFAHEIAQLALWLAEHQMNVESFKEFGQANATLPLSDAGQITQGNACRLDWEEVCPKGKKDETYILGNPPYLGGKLQSKEQKEDTKLVFKNFNKHKNIDYIGCWFLKASTYISTSDSIEVKSAFVTTNSINQGTQVIDLWPNIFSCGVEINYAIKDFVWENSAKNKARVICSIIGLRKKNDQDKFIYHNSLKKSVRNINAYLIDAHNIFIEKRTFPLSKDLPKMIQGNIALDDGNLQLSLDERTTLVHQFPQTEKLIRRVVGSRELINGLDRYCLWITLETKDMASSISSISDRIEKVRISRLNGATNAKSCANRPHEFCMVNTAKSTQIVLPRVSSIRREYIPSDFMDSDVIVSDAAQVILDADPFVFALFNSKIHTVWTKNLAGKLKNDYRYSAGVCWYSFPFPNISAQRKLEIAQFAFRILEEREKHSEKNLAQLYDPDRMPDGLREAHHQNDMAIERCYRSKPFESDEERLEYMFKLYERMIEEEKNAGTLFAKQKKTRKKKANA